MAMLNEKHFSTRFCVRKLNENDLSIIHSLMKGNTLFYKYCGRECCERDILDDMKNLPPQKTMEDKYYVGFFEKKCTFTNENALTDTSEKSSPLIAIMDLIDGYPDEKTAFIGFFMMNSDFQGKKIGSSIILELSGYLKSLGFEKIRLGIDKDNPQSNAFWKRNGFQPVKEVSLEQGVIIVAEKML